jgi:hypothetical protein
MKKYNEWICSQNTLHTRLDTIICERSFSIVEYVDHRLRSSLAQPNFNALMLMYLSRER